jgi:hypothetical protein
VDLPPLQPAEPGPPSPTPASGRTDPTPSPASFPPGAPDPASDFDVSDEIELVMLDQVSRDLPDDFDIVVTVDDAEEAEAGIHTVRDALAAIDGAQTREELIKQLIRPVVAETCLNVLFLPRGDLLVALAAWGTSLPAWQIRALVVPPSGDATLQQTIDERTVVKGPVPADLTVQTMIAIYLQAPTPQEVCLTPIYLKDKLVNLLCTHFSSAIDEGVIESMSQIAERAAAAYARLIMKLRQKD